VSSVPARHATAGLLVACTAQFLIGADGLAVAIALPALQRDLGVAPIEAQWVLTAYGLCFGGGLLLGGRLGDLYGRRRLLVCGMVLFAAGSVLAAASPALDLLLAGRAAQGAGSAAAIPAGLALIGSLFPPGPQRTRGLARLAGMASLGIISGMLAGGLITATLGWRWVFWLMAPLALATALAAPYALPEVAAAGERRLDVPGALLVTLGALALLLGITRIERSGVASAVVLGPVVVSAALLAAFVAWERRAPAPLIRPDILAVRRLRSATASVGVNSITFTSVVYVGTLWLQDGQGYSAWRAGIALAPIDVVAFVVAGVASGLVARRSPRALLVACFTADALALGWLARAPDAVRYERDVLLPLTVLGVAMCVTFVVATQQAVADVDADDKGLASGIFETANHLFGGAVGVAVYATVITAGSYGAAFATAAAIAAVGAVLALRAPARP
jgi:EmrB/QacA subfamily drug resistance transporter